MQGRLAALPGERAIISDWANHISTIFPEVRLKRYLEMRGADGGPWRRLPALPAYWAGILYDDGSLDAAWELIKNWTAAERQKLRDDVPKIGFAATIAGRTVLQLATATLALAEQGLARRRLLNGSCSMLACRRSRPAEMPSVCCKTRRSRSRRRTKSSISAARSASIPIPSRVSRPKRSADSKVSRSSNSTPLAISCRLWRRS